MSLTANEEKFIKLFYQIDLLKINIKKLENQMWNEINLIMKNNIDGSQWIKRRNKKIEYKDQFNIINDQINNLKDQIEELE